MSAGASPRLRVGAAVALAAALWVVGGHLAGFDAGLLCMAPAFVVALPLLAGRYPAEAVPLRRRSQPAIANDAGQGAVIT
jgi:hypothetical protein